MFNPLSIEEVTNCDSVLVDQKPLLYLKPTEFLNERMWIMWMCLKSSSCI